MPYKKGELPHGGHGSDPRTVKEWRASEPLVETWLSKKRPGTARKYGEDFRAFWLDFLSQRYKSIEEWLDAVKKAQYERDFEIQTAWAKDLEAYILARKISHKTRAKIASAVMSFLEPRIGKHNARNYKFTFGTPEEVDAEAHESDTETIDYHDIAKLAHAAKSKRDKALVLVNISGLGVGEILSFNSRWFQIYDLLKSRKPIDRWQTRIEPVRIDLVRKKKNVKFYTFLLDDAIDALAVLLEQRETETSRSLTEKDPLFVNYKNEPITEQRIQEQFRYLRENASLEHPERFHPHEIGRDTLITLFANHHIGPFNSKGKSLPAEFCCGHTIDDLKYNKSAWTPKGEQQLREIFESLRPELNLITHRGKEIEILKGTIDLQARRALVEMVKMLKTEPPETTGDTAEQILQLLEEQGITEAANRWSRRRIGDRS
ncbi:MAG TPA: tyrosine-type recombinase/integrase [Candidatus Bathyarchaeia archaeon]|nr:tyrosine-type recombinase/integrase [Candidatus Bathyarchaeia archaeon]